MAPPAARMVLGARSVGDVPPSGVWRPEEVPAEVPFDDLDHAYWNEFLIGSVRQRGAAAVGEARRDAEAVWKKTKEEEAKGFIRRVERGELDESYGPAFWRAVRRFGIWQGKIRCCENCAESNHNGASAFHERLWCETADLPARIAAAFAAELAGSPCGMLLGTDDMEAAYRRVLLAAPQYSVVAVWDTDAEEVRLFVMPGFNFGLHSAVLQYNRVSHFMTEAARRLGAVATGHYYDDFVCAEPSFAEDSGQVFLNAVMRELGYPASDEKHEPMRASNVFLGVRTDFSGFASERVARMRADSRAVGEARDVVADALKRGELSSSVAGKLAGQLGFMTCWAAYRAGRAALQPIYARASEQSQLALSEALRLVLRYFESVLSSEEGLPAREVRCVEGGRPTVLVWSDASAEESAEELGRMGFVVLFPGEYLGGVWVPERWVHASAAVPAGLVASFARRRTYIGLYEQVAAVAVYQTLGAELAGRRVVHFVDNQGAMAGLAKGYARVADAARVVHAFHAWNAGARVSVWFEYVRSKANIADLPSRGEFDVLRAMGSAEVEMVLPRVDQWDCEAAELVREARARVRGPGVLGIRKRGARAKRRRS